MTELIKPSRRAFVFGTAALVVPIPGIVRAGSLDILAGYPLVEPGHIWIRGISEDGRMVAATSAAALAPYVFNAFEPRPFMTFRRIIAFGDHWGDRTLRYRGDLDRVNTSLMITGAKQVACYERLPSEQPGFVPAFSRPAEIPAPRPTDL